MGLRAFSSRLHTYLTGKTWYWYVLPWLFGLYLFVEILAFELGGQAGSLPVMVMQSVNFFLHEMAHLTAAFLPDLLTAAAGSGSELLLGLGLIIGGFIGRTYFASLFGFLWFMLACQATADYMGDARAQSLSLVSFGGGDPIHDWNFIFTKLGMLEQAGLIAGLTRWTGILAGVAGLSLALYLIIRMYFARRAAASQARMAAVKEDIMARNQPAGAAEPTRPKDIYPTPRA